MLGHFLETRDTAGRAHDERLREPFVRALPPERAGIAGDDRPEVCVGRRRRRPFELAELGRDLVRRGDVRPGQPAPHLLRHGPLVRGVAEREEQAHRDRLGVELR